MTASGTDEKAWLRANAAEIAALSFCIARLWLMALPSSLWTDEAVTAFVAQHPADPSLAIVPPYTQSVYYALPPAMNALFGFSEIGYRLPSVLAMGAALYFVARMAARIAGPGAAWFAVFTCLAIPGIDYFAIDAKPYALGMCCAAGALYFLARWFDSARWRDAALFLVFAALLWRVQQVYWAFYLVFGIYGLMRLRKSESRVGWVRAAAVSALLVLALIPVALESLALLRDAGAHVFVAPPAFLDLRHWLRRDWDLIAVCGGAAWLLARLSRWPPGRAPRGSDIVLVLAWWLVTPIAMFVFSRVSGDSLFVPRYLSLSLPGVALTATLAAAFFIPPGYWRPAVMAMALGALVFAGNWNQVWPAHDPAGWRPAAQYVNRLSDSADTPILCTSPFIEAVPPVWRPDYPLPGFLYAQLFAYPLRGKTYLFPFRPIDPAKDYAAKLSAETLPRFNRFLIYGGIPGAEYWRTWLSKRPELQGWHSDARDFGDIRVVVFDR